MDRVPGKWEWIEEKLREMGELHLADLAWQLNESLERIYGKTATEGWEIVITSYNLDFQNADTIRKKTEVILSVARESGYCVACDADYIEVPRHEYDKSKGCVNCRLAKVCGLCVYPFSTFSKVFRSLKEMVGCN